MLAALLLQMMKACMGSYKDYPSMCRGFHAAAVGKHAAGARPADVLVGSLTTLTYLMDVGEALGVPVWGVKVGSTLWLCTLWLVATTSPGARDRCKAMYRRVRCRL